MGRFQEMKPLKKRRYGTGKRFKRIYMVAPKHPENFWSMQGTADILGAKTLMPNSALATLMALTPDGVDVEYCLCDENVSVIDLDIECDLVAITGGTLHAIRIQELADMFRKKGRPIAIGGAFASIEKETCRDLADYHFIGEAEYTWPRFLRQWMAGNPEKEYTQAEYIHMADSPAPDWSLINADDYVNISVQTSRGCPNQCDFCDVIQYVGRRYRTKTVPQVLGEVNNAHKAGARTVFFSDDNFLGDKRFTKRLLSKLIEWNVLQARPLSFSTQITVQVADDGNLLKMFADCRFSVLFLGVETTRKASLQEVHKTQNIEYDIYERIKSVSRFGIIPFIGLIVGFDSDDKSIFNDLHHFVENTNSPIAGISLLNAPKHTPLYKRLKAEGRLMEEGFSGEWQLGTNIVPKQMSRETLFSLYWELFQKIYRPELFEIRLEQWLKRVEYATNAYRNKKGDVRKLLYALRIVKHFLLKEEPEVRSLFFRAMIKTWKIDPKFMRRFFTLITQFSHFYHFVNKKRT